MNDWWVLAFLAGVLVGMIIAPVTWVVIYDIVKHGWCVVPRQCK